MSKVEIRPIDARDELDSCYDLWGGVFPEPREFFERRIHYDSTYDMATTWAAYVQGNLAAAIQIFPYESDVDGIRMKIGGIGSVATHPNYRRLGLAQSLLRAQSRWMNKRGYDASLLFTGIHSFYEQVGWRKAEESRQRVYGHTLDVEMNRAKKMEMAHSLMFRPIQEKDLPALSEIYDIWRVGHPGAWIRTWSYWHDMHNWLPDDIRVVERDGQILAYAIYRVRKGVLEVREMCYQINAEDIAIQLWQNLLIVNSNVECVCLQFPSDHAVLQYLQNIGLKAEIQPTSMWKVFDSCRLLKKLEPSFSRRAVDAKLAPLRIVLQVEDEDIFLIIGSDGVECLRPLSDSFDYDVKQRLNDGELMHWIFYGAEDQKSVPDALRVLFPSRCGHLWWTDHF